MILLLFSPAKLRLQKGVKPAPSVRGAAVMELLAASIRDRPELFSRRYGSTGTPFPAWTRKIKA